MISLLIIREIKIKARCHKDRQKLSICIIQSVGEVVGPTGIGGRSCTLRDSSAHCSTIENTYAYLEELTH